MLNTLGAASLRPQSSERTSATSLLPVLRVCCERCGVEAGVVGTYTLLSCCTAHPHHAFHTQVLSAADAPAAVRLALYDAATFDYATKTGGMDGSIISRWLPVSLLAL
jgi:hypothetical protein